MKPYICLCLLSHRWWCSTSKSRVKGIRFPRKLLELVDFVAPKINETPNFFIVKAVQTRVTEIFVLEQLEANLPIIELKKKIAEQVTSVMGSRSQKISDEHSPS